MQADQAAGLRSKQLRCDLRVVSLIDTPADFAPRLAQALMARDQKVLLVDSLGRHARTSKTQFIFGWQQQVARQGLQTMWVHGVDVLHAPGAQAGDAAIVQASAAYDFVLFDGHTLQAELAFDTRTSQALIVALNARPDMLDPAYALIKTLHQSKLDWHVLLLGDSAPAERVMAAAAYFMPAQSARLERANIDADAHLHALAARISAAESGTRPFDNNTGGECAQHG